MQIKYIKACPFGVMCSKKRRLTLTRETRCDDFCFQVSLSLLTGTSTVS